MRELQQRDLQIRRSQARAEGRRLELEPNEREQEILNTQRQEFVSDLSEAQQAQFKAEQARLWALIPEEFRGRAERLAQGGY